MGGPFAELTAGVSVAASGSGSAPARPVSRGLRWHRVTSGPGVAAARLDLVASQAGGGVVRAGFGRLGRGIGGAGGVGGVLGAVLSLLCADGVSGRIAGVGGWAAGEGGAGLRRCVAAG